ncbi:MAG TPA: LuxR C-terminal-related transcriptional regulator [Phycisphaerae bacterium]|nr:LuxR C-terminal-related transcriptional regulator [Phycisphaerae bacterium]
MGQAGRLRLSDAQSVFRLLGEVRELARDAALWRRHAVAGLLRLTGGHVGLSALEAIPIQGTGADVAMRVEVGWDAPWKQQRLADFIARGEITRHPGYAFLRAHALRPFTCSRAMMVADAAWYASESVEHFHRAVGCDDFIHSRRLIADSGWADMLVLHRPWGEPPFDARARRVVALFHDELARLWHAPPTSNHCDCPPHLRRLVAQFRQGRSEKEAAVALRLSQHTVHAYAKELYRRLDVRSRGEAMARLGWCDSFTPQVVIPSGPTMPPA